MKPQILAATLFATLTLVAGLAWSLSCITPYEVETTTLEIVSAKVNGEEVGLTRYKAERAPTLQSDWSQSCGRDKRRAVVWIGQEHDYIDRVTFTSIECEVWP